MNLLIITPWYPNPVHLQDGNFVRAQAELLARQHRVEVVCVYEGRNSGARPQVLRTVESGVRVLRCSYPGDGPRPLRLLHRRQAWRAALLARELRPDLIHAHVLIDGGIVASRLAERLGVPFVVTGHSHRWLEPWPWLRLPELWLARRAARSAAAVIAVSPALARGMRHHGIKAKVRVISNVIATELFYPEERTIGQPFTFLHVSDFTPNKNIPALLTAFAEVARLHPDTRLHLAGNGDHDLLRSLVRTSHPFGKLRDHPRSRPVEISGPHEPPSVARLMRAADAFVLTSMLETQSLVTVEALLSGLPVISTRSGGPDGIVTTPQRGELVAVDDQKQLQDAMVRRVKAGPDDLTTRLSRHRNARAEFGDVAEKLNQLYTQLLS